jgi:hypothetical protein
MNLHEIVQRIEGEFKGETTRIEPLVGRGGDPTRMDVLQRAETVTKHGATDDEEGEYYEWLDSKCNKDIRQRVGERHLQFSEITSLAAKCVVARLRW